MRPGVLYRLSGWVMVLTVLRCLSPTWMQAFTASAVLLLGLQLWHEGMEMAEGDGGER
jgi:hypothetical protein